MSRALRHLGLIPGLWRKTVEKIHRRRTSLQPAGDGMPLVIKISMKRYLVLSLLFSGVALADVQTAITSPQPDEYTEIAPFESSSPRKPAGETKEKDAKKPREASMGFLRLEALFVAD
jgi:hypothetical protein